MEAWHTIRISRQLPGPPLVCLLERSDEHPLAAGAKREEVRTLHHVGGYIVWLPNNVTIKAPKGLIRGIQRPAGREVRYGVVGCLEQAELGSKVIASAADADPPADVPLKSPHGIPIPSCDPFWLRDRGSRWGLGGGRQRDRDTCTRARARTRQEMKDASKKDAGSVGINSYNTYILNMKVILRACFRKYCPTMEYSGPPIDRHTQLHTIEASTCMHYRHSMVLCTLYLVQGTRYTVHCRSNIHTCPRYTSYQVHNIYTAKGT